MCQTVADQATPLSPLLAPNKNMFSFPHSHSLLLCFLPLSFARQTYCPEGEQVAVPSLAPRIRNCIKYAKYTTVAFLSAVCCLNLPLAAETWPPPPCRRCSCPDDTAAPVPCTRPGSAPAVRAREYVM